MNETKIEHDVAHEYWRNRLEEEQERTVLLVKMPRAKMLRITLGYKSYMDKLPELANVIDQMKRLIETIPYPVEVENLGRNVKWKKGAEE